MKKHFAQINLLKSFLISFILLIWNGSLQAEEIVCKKIMCGVEYGSIVVPKIFRTVTETIRVYVKYAEYVESATCDKTGVSISIGTKRGNSDPCASYVDLVITCDNSVKNSESGVISLFGNILGVKTLTTKFMVSIDPEPNKIEGISIYFNNMEALNEIYINHLYRIIINWSKFHQNVNTDYLQNDFEVISSKSNNTFTSDTILVRFKSNLVLPKIFNAIRIKNNSVVCNKGDYVYQLPKIYSITELKGLPDLVDAGLNRKFGGVASVCDGDNVSKVSTNRTTLDIVRPQIPAPTAANPVVYQEVNWPDIRWGVKNIGESTTASFTIQLKNGSTILQSQTLNGLASGEEKLFSYVRPKSKKRLYRKLDCNPDQDVFIYSKTPRSEAELIMLEPYIWSDPAKFTIVIDAFQKVLETDEANNTKEY